jgi:hypothetical protein
VNITEEGIIKYIEAFNEALEEESSRFFPKDESNQLLHKSLLPAKIVCYVSTQYGVGIEYVSAATTSVESVRGSARVEDLFVQAPKRLWNIGPMFNIAAAGIEISKLTLAGGFPFRLSTNDATVTFREIRFSSDELSWERNVEYAEIYGDRNELKWSVEAAQNKAKDEVLSALFLKQQAKSREQDLHEYISNFQEKSVLLLGSYDPEGEKRLEAISNVIEKLGYEPILIKHIPDFEHYDISQKVTAVGAICRIVVIDDSSPSGHLSEVEICRNNRWVTVLLRHGGKGASWMTAAASLTSNVILEKDYDCNKPDVAVSKAIDWAESKIKELQITLNKMYPWREES